jgi:LuxR family maltose regulon positive regulatory protein
MPGHKLVVVSAPAGYGKTTCLTQWAGSSSFPIAWLSLGPEDNDFGRFFRYLLAAWEVVQPDVVESPLGALLSGLAPDSEAVLSAFINFANNVPNHTVFVLDDYHLIEDPAIHQALAFLLDHLPPALHFVLAGRGQQPLPLARYRARAELREFGAGDLLFLSQETGEFLNDMMGLDLAPTDIEPLQTQLEGWIAGLQLVALSLRRGLTGPDELVVSGRHRFIADYLVEEVLDHLPDHMRRFLFRTSILDSLCAPLCETVTGHEGGQEMLETLEGQDLYLTPLDDRREWFRYHPLFAAVLQEELGRRHSDAVAALHQRAASWYLEHDLPGPAFRHAVAGDDSDLVARIIERYFAVMLNTGQLRVLSGWLDALPVEWHFRYPLIGIAHAGVLAFTGFFEACIAYIDKIEGSLQGAEREDKRLQLARVSTYRCVIACAQYDLAGAESYADRALKDLPESDLFYRANIHHSLGDVYRHFGRWREAREHYLTGLDLVPDPSQDLMYRFRSVHVYGALADLELRQGRLGNAAGYWGKALAVVEERDTWGFYPLPLIGWVYIRLGEIHYERNELAASNDYLVRGLKRAEPGGDVRTMIAGYLITGRLKLTEGDFAAAAENLEQARPLVEDASFLDWRGRFERLQLELWLAQDRLRAAVNWSDEKLSDDALEERPESEVTRLAMARVLLFKGDGPSLGRALALLKRLGKTAEAEGRAGIQVEALALEALAYWHRGGSARALTALEHALRLAEPEGYVRLFADLGLPMARLLQEARSRDVMPAYVTALLAAFGGDDSSTVPGKKAKALPDPLTKRELQVLELMAAGLTNNEIAEELVISPETVKKHAGNIYGKLGVGGRTEAAAKVRELDLLD